MTQTGAELGSAAERTAEGILFSVPGGVLLSVLDGLSAVELMRTVALTSRALTELLKGEGRSQDLWGQGVLLRLQHSIPARRFFVDRTVPLMRRPDYAPYKLTCDARLREILGRAGLDVDWDERGRALLPPSPTAITETTFAAWAQAFACKACGEAGAARRQCAGCGELLCATCAHRCAQDTRCGFALCEDCHAEYSVPGRQVEADVAWGLDAPGLVPPPCGDCPFSLQCPAHAGRDILMCRACCLTMCAIHPYNEATQVGMEMCSKCLYVGCTDCLDFTICLDCYESMCPEREVKAARDESFHSCSGCGHTSCPTCQRERGATPLYCMECSESRCADCVSTGDGTLVSCMECSHSVCDACLCSGAHSFVFCRECDQPHCAECLPACGLCDECH
jgi:hypothetical protein